MKERNTSRYEIRRRANSGLFSACQIKEETFKSSNSSKKILKNVQNCIKTQNFSFFNFSSKRKHKFWEKKHFCEKDYHNKRTLGQIWKRSTKWKFSACIFAPSSNWQYSCLRNLNVELMILFPNIEDDRKK